jgi:hypothetical protein
MRAGGSARTWVGLSDNGLMTYFDTQSQVAVIPPPAIALGIASSVRSSDRLSPGGGTANIAIAAFAKSDISSPDAGITWAYYGTARKFPNAATTIGMELSVGCVGQGATEVNPYQTGGGNSAIGLWMSSGSEAFEAGEDVHPASSAITVVSNGSTWDKGLVFGANALTRAPVTGVMKAIQLPAKAEIQWNYDNVVGHRSAFIRSDGTGSGGVGISFQDTSMYVVDDTTEAIPLLKVRVDGVVATSGMFAVGGEMGPTWSSGSTSPPGAQPKGSLYSRTGGAVGSTLYVSAGGGVWNAVAGV